MKTQTKTQTKTQSLSKEVCPYCGKKIEVPYGFNIPCTFCGGLMNVFDPSRGNGSEGGFRSGSLFKDSRPTSHSLHEGQSGTDLSGTNVSYKDIGGLDQTIEKLDILVNGKNKYPDLWRRLGEKQTRGVLLSGPPGVGKTLLIKALATESQRKVSLVQGSEIKGWRQGASEGNLTFAYEAARPDGIFVIDEVDAIGGKRDQMVNETNTSIVTTLCSIIDGAKYNDDVTVIATTNRPYALDDALRRKGRFDIEIEVLPPDTAGREEIFKIHTKTMPLAKDVDPRALALRAHGFTGADIAGVCSALSQKLLEDCARKLKSGIPEKKIVKNLLVHQHDFLKIIDETIPSILRGFSTGVSKASWADIGGLENIKKEVQEIIIWPLKYPALMERMKMRLPRGMFLYGGPGCGKTLLGKAIAGEIDYNFLVVNGPSLISKWEGDTEEAIRELFWKARLARPCIIFMDEIEAIAPVRGTSHGSAVTDRAVSQLLTEMDGVLTLKDVFVIAATNRRDLVDPALLRSGRFDIEYEVLPPDETARKEIFGIHLRGVPSNGVNCETLAQLCKGRTGADIEWICNTAKKFAVKRYIDSGEVQEKAQVIEDDLLQAIKETSGRK